jgi:hypothetical protein
MSQRILVQDLSQPINPCPHGLGREGARPDETPKTIHEAPEIIPHPKPFNGHGRTDCPISQRMHIIPSRRIVGFGGQWIGMFDLSRQF